MARRPVQMPDPQVPSSRMDRRFDTTDVSRDECMADIDFGATTILEEKMIDPCTPGTAGDETGIAAEIIRRETRKGY